MNKSYESVGSEEEKELDTHFDYESDNEPPTD